MKEFLKKLKLIDHLTTRLDLERQAFTDRLSAITEPGSTGVFTDAFDVLSSSEKEFKGFVDRQSFKLKRRRRLFDVRFNTAVASGTTTEADGKLTIETEINAFHNFMLVLYGFLIAFYAIFLDMFAVSDSKVQLVVILLIPLHAAIFFSIPYFIMRKSVKRMKYELEREFFYLTKEKNQ